MQIIASKLFSYHFVEADVDIRFSPDGPEKTVYILYHTVRGLYRELVVSLFGYFSDLIT